MRKFKYIARSPTGKKVSGILQAESDNELIEIMLNHDYKLLRYKEFNYHKAMFSFMKINKNDLLNFCENINMMLKAGLSLKDSIHLCQDVIGKLVFKNILADIEINLSKGKSFYDCVNDYPDQFPIFFRTMINLAEVSGNLKDIFTYLINYYRFDINVRKKITNALFYPCLLLLMCLTVIIVMSTVIVPSFVKIFNDMKVEIPLITKVIVSISNFVANYYLIVIGIIVLLVLFMYLYSKTNKGKIWVDKLKTKIIVLKKFTEIIVTSRFCMCLKILIDSGIPIVTSLDISSSLIGNEFLKSKFGFTIDLIKKGSKISQALYSLDFFPQLVIETIYISEKTANLSYSLGVLSQIYEDDLHNKIQRLTTILEPMLILFIALIVIILLISIFIPLFSMLNNIGV